LNSEQCKATATNLELLRRYICVQSLQYCIDPMTEIIQEMETSDTAFLACCALSMFTSDILLAGLCIRPRLSVCPSVVCLSVCLPDGRIFQKARGSIFIKFGDLVDYGP